jgi:hypothetical protein
MRRAQKRCNEKGSAMGSSGTAPATSDSAVDSGKMLFRLEKALRLHRKSNCNQCVETILVEPADSRNLEPFGTVGSGPAVELRRGFGIAKFGISGTYLLIK